MKKTLLFVTVLVGILTQALAQVPSMINYQGRLVDGTNLVNGDISLELRLYDADTDGNLLYVDSSTVSVIDGLYSTYIGDNTTYGALNDALTNSMVYMEIVINSTALSPRERLVAAPYALYASNSANGVPDGAVIWSSTSPNPVFENSGYQPVLVTSVYEEVSGGWVNVEQVNPNTILPRYYYTSLTFDNKMWIIGGFNRANGNGIRDVWSSSDGSNWVCATESAPWRGDRWLHQCVDFNDNIWLMGGEFFGSYPYCKTNDVWRSSDGTNWTCVTDGAPWSPRSSYASIVFDNKMWIIGGNLENLDSGEEGWAEDANDVWYTIDGSNWVCATDDAPWKARRNTGLVVLNNEMLLFGGETQSPDYDTNDVWRSSDGTNWTCVTEGAPWSPRGGHEYCFPYVLYNNEIQILGGGEGVPCWSSDDGVSWETTTIPSVPYDNNQSGLLVFDNKMWTVSAEEVNFYVAVTIYTNCVVTHRSHGGYYLYKKQ